MTSRYSLLPPGPERRPHPYRTPMVIMLLRFDSAEEMEDFAEEVELDPDEYAVLEVTEDRITVQ